MACFFSVSTGGSEVGGSGGGNLSVDVADDTLCGGNVEVSISCGEYDGEDGAYEGDEGAYEGEGA